MAINFIPYKDSDKTRTMYAKSNEELFNFFFFLQRCQEGLEGSMRGSEFVFDSADALYYDLNKISLSRGGSYIDSPEWLKNKKATINPKK